MLMMMEEVSQKSVKVIKVQGDNWRRCVRGNRMRGGVKDCRAFANSLPLISYEFVSL